MNEYGKEGTKWVSVLKKERVCSWLLALAGMLMCACVFIGESVDEEHKGIWVGVGFAIVIPPTLGARAYLKGKDELW